MMSDVVRIVKCFVYGIGTGKHIAKHVTEWKAVLCGPTEYVSVRSTRRLR